MERELINFCIQQKTSELNSRISYYKNSYLPEIESYSGSTQAQHLERAKNKLSEFKIAINDYRKSGHEQYLGFTLNEKANYIRLYAIEQREQAADWADSNLFIKWRSLRNAVNALTKLKKILPQLEIYSNHWLCSRTVINL